MSSIVWLLQSTEMILRNNLFWQMLRKFQNGIRRPVCRHLGIDRHLGSRTDNKKTVQIDRRASYSRDYGNACMNLPISFHMRKTFALPRMLHGLEISKLGHSDTMQLETLQRSIPRRLQLTTPCFNYFYCAFVNIEFKKSCVVKFAIVGGGRGHRGSVGLL